MYICKIVIKLSAICAQKIKILCTGEGASLSNWKRGFGSRSLSSFCTIFFDIVSILWLQIITGHWFHSFVTAEHSHQKTVRVKRPYLNLDHERKWGVWIFLSIIELDKAAWRRSGVLNHRHLTYLFCLIIIGLSYFRKKHDSKATWAANFFGFSTFSMKRKWITRRGCKTLHDAQILLLYCFFLHSGQTSSRTWYIYRRSELNTIKTPFFRFWSSPSLSDCL